MKDFVGIVVSNKNQNTATVKVSRVVTHPVYKKRFTRSAKIHAHDTLGVALGDTVRIVETRPISKTKNFRVVEIVKKKDLSV